MCRSTSLVHVVRSAACWTLILVVTSPAGNAAIVTFDDAMPGSPYVVTDVFVSEGVKFEVDPFFSSIGFLSGPGVFVGPTPFGVPPGADPSAHPSNLNLDMDVVGSARQHVVHRQWRKCQHVYQRTADGRAVVGP